MLSFESSSRRTSPPRQLAPAPRPSPYWAPQPTRTGRCTRAALQAVTGPTSFPKGCQHTGRCHPVGVRTTMPGPWIRGRPGPNPCVGARCSSSDRPRDAPLLRTCERCTVRPSNAWPEPRHLCACPQPTRTGRAAQSAGRRKPSCAAGRRQAGVGSQRTSADWPMPSGRRPNGRCLEPWIRGHLGPDP